MKLLLSMDKNIQKIRMISLIRMQKKLILAINLKKDLLKRIENKLRKERNKIREKNEKE